MDNDRQSCEPGFKPAWYALYTCYQHEKNSARILANKGFLTFLPLYTAAHQWKDRVKRLSLPLFPCYVFIRGGINRRFEVLTTPGIHGWVGVAGNPSPISDAEIQSIRQVVETSLRVEPHPFLKCGDWVRVKSGPLAGIEGILVRKKNLLRLVLSVELLEKSVAVEVDASTVERVPGNRPKRLQDSRGTLAERFQLVEPRGSGSSGKRRNSSVLGWAL
jgi:transcription antitermination factor NusG